MKDARKSKRKRREHLGNRLALLGVTFGFCREYAELLFKRKGLRISGERRELEKTSG